MEERSRIFAEEVDVKHGLGVGQGGKADGQLGIESVWRTEIRYPTRHRNLPDTENIKHHYHAAPKTPPPAMTHKWTKMDQEPPNLVMLP